MMISKKNRKGFLGKWQCLIKKQAYLCRDFKSIDDYKKPVDILKKKTSSVY